MLPLFRYQHQSQDYLSIGHQINHLLGFQKEFLQVLTVYFLLIFPLESNLLSLSHESLENFQNLRHALFSKHSVRLSPYLNLMILLKCPILEVIVPHHLHRFNY